MKVIKRDGTQVPFDIQKIINAISQAMVSVDKNPYGCTTAERIALEIASLNKEEMSVEEIQDLVEKKLIASEYPDVAKAYIVYRNKRALARDGYAEIINIISEKLTASNVQNQNANVDEASFGGRVGEMSSALTKKYALDYLVSPMARENHLNNEIYIHDLDAYAVGSHNCLSIPFDDLLAKGFNTRQTDVRPANSINTAFQLVAVIFQLQSLQQFGGVSATHLDWTMVPYVRKSFIKHFKDGFKYVQKEKWYDLTGQLAEFDNIYPHINRLAQENPSIDDIEYRHQTEAYKYAMEMTEREVYQAVEAMYHNLK